MSSAQVLSVKGLPLSGQIAIPSFSADASGDDEGAFPYCCGITVIGSFGNAPLDAADYDSDYAGWMGRDNYDNDKYTQEYDYVKRTYVQKKNPNYNPTPWAKTDKLTKKEATEWWNNFALEGVGTSTLTATTTEDQGYARRNLLAAGWKEAVKFRSRGTGSIITLLSYTVPDYVRK